MKYIDYVGDWFSLYINPVDYIEKRAVFVEHIFATVPYLTEIAHYSEARALKDVIAVNADILIQLMEEDNKEDAANAFVTLKEQIIRLTKLTQEYALTHFDKLCANDPLFKKCQDYIQQSAQDLTHNEQQAIKEAYLQMRIQELCLELTCQLAEKDQIEDLVTQTAIDKLSIEVEKFKLLGKIRTIILGSQTGTLQLKNSLREQLLAVFTRVQEHTFFQAKFDKGYMRQLINQFLTEQFARLQMVERINTEIKVDELSLQGLLLQEKLKHRSQHNFEMIQQQIENKKRKIAASQDSILALKQEVEMGLMQLCQNVLRSPVTDELQEVIARFNLHELLVKKPKQKGLVKRLAGFFKVVSASIEQLLPSSIDLQLGVASFTTGALVLGPNPLGMATGFGVGALAIKTHHTVKQVATEINQEWQACAQVLEGKFSRQYRSSAYHVTKALERVCGNDTLVANAINAFYIKTLFNCDLRLAAYASMEESLEAKHLSSMRTQLNKHYQELREGKIKAKDFWEKTFKKDVALIVDELQVLTQEQTHACLLSLFEGSTHNEFKTHQNRLLGVQETLTELKCLADRNALKTMRENNTALYRALVKTPLDFDFEDHIAQLVYHHAPSYLFFWLNEQAELPAKQLASPLTRFQGKTFWHLLAEMTDGDLLSQKILTEPKEPATRRGAQFLLRIQAFFASFRQRTLFDVSVCYQEMNPLAYAFLHRQVPLLRIYLQEILAHPSQAKKLGIHKVFSFLLTEYPSLMKTLESIRPQGFERLTAVLPISNRVPIEMAMLAGLTLYVAKKGALPSTLDAWQGLLEEMTKSPSEYVQVKLLKEYDAKEIAILAQKCAITQKPLLPLLAANDNPALPEPTSMKDTPKVLLLNYPFKAEEKRVLARNTQKRGKRTSRR